MGLQCLGPITQEHRFSCVRAELHLFDTLPQDLLVLNDGEVALEDRTFVHRIPSEQLIGSVQEIDDAVRGATHIKVLCSEICTVHLKACQEN